VSDDGDGRRAWHVGGITNAGAPVVAGAVEGGAAACRVGGFRGAPVGFGSAATNALAAAQNRAVPAAL